MTRWKVERAGVAPDYGTGWIAYSFGGRGATFSTWRQAYDWAHGQAVHDAALTRQAAWKLIGGHRFGRRTEASTRETVRRRTTPTHGFGASS